MDSIPLTINEDELLNKLRIQKESSEAGKVLKMAEKALSIARPKVLYKLANIQSKGENHIVVEGIKLKSRILRVNTEGLYRVFPYIATCGGELDSWASTFDDVLENYRADAINEIVLKAAVKAFKNNLNHNYGPGKTSSMNPGSLSDWPIEEQRKLFEILGDPFADIGVTLTESFLMRPFKSVSGIRFSSEEDFQNCSLCPRENCPGRRTEYISDLFKRKYQVSGRN